MTDEKIVWQGAPDIKNWIGTLMLSVVVCLSAVPFLIGIAGTVIVCVLVLQKCSSYRLTTQRVIEQRGLLSNETREIDIRDIRNINVRQTILQRLFNLGDIEISSAGMAGIEVRFSGVSAPEALKERIRSLRA